MLMLGPNWPCLDCSIESREFLVEGEEPPPRVSEKMILPVPPSGFSCSEKRSGGGVRLIAYIMIRSVKERGGH